MTDKPVTTYIVSVFEKPHWRTVLTTKDAAKALDGKEDRRQGAGQRDHAEGEALAKQDMGPPMPAIRRQAGHTEHVALSVWR